MQKFSKRVSPGAKRGINTQQATILVNVTFYFHAEELKQLFYPYQCPCKYLYYNKKAGGARFCCPSCLSSVSFLFSFSNRIPSVRRYA